MWQILWRHLSQGVLGSLIGGASGYAGGELGIRLRERYNRANPKTPMRNYWGDTEGMYVVFYAFIIASGFGLVSLCLPEHFTWLSSINAWSIGLPLSATALCAYASFYTN